MPDDTDDPLDVARVGLAAAASVVERMLELGRNASSGLRIPFPANGSTTGFDAPSAGDDATDAPTDPTSRARELRRFRADAERLVELYAEWTRMLVDGAAALAEQAGEGPIGTSPLIGGGDALVLGPASAGATTTASAWLHVLDGPPAAPAVVHATDLVAHDGAVIPRSSVATTPAALDTTTARSTVEVRVSVVVPVGSAVGTYHGHLLAVGLPEVVLPLRLEVVA